MTFREIVANASINAATDDLPRPETAQTDVAPLPRPMRSPNVADTGRVSFGAGFRLPSTR